uniref:Venom toxin n=1 Tax=Hemiscorpius lepturus TaxID=520031 RepID=A0A1L4BJ47_HEMLE|nr:venom toxin [Hemiscorpius lepturus]
MFRLVLLSSLAVTIYSLSCPCWEQEDKTDYCGPPPTDCPLGTTSDVCGCCPVCYKVLGESCGGMWGTMGQCGPGLFCKRDVESSENEYTYENSDGVCIAQDKKTSRS